MSCPEVIPEFFILDVDGVLSTGQFLYSSNGKNYKVFGPHDADGLKMLKGKLKIAFISADLKGFEISKKRVSDMGYPLFKISESDRLSFIESKFGFKNVIYMGDGYYDAPVLKACVFGIAPANARKEAKEAAKFITESRAGEGAVLDACLEIINRYFK
ncbi:MAG: HAD hydrolase family protein [Candidatus Omnitrophica bacterium]|nr:HAD hydrolase family protein [Candidatus Omnitrophota bacterium]